MDYVEAFKNLRTNNKWGRKSPHKAVLMLTVIELYEKNVLTDNEIRYDETLKSTFLKVWNRVLPDEPLFHPEAYLPFWYLQSDSFWHIVPIRGKEDILSLMRDTNIKPSEVKLNDSVRCAELDEDLFFLMTIASGRSSLKRALLETYTQLSEYQIDRMSESADNIVDHSLSAMDEYEQILSSNNTDKNAFENESSTELEKQFKKLSDDLQITLSYEYFAFLKNHRNERDMLREICPNVYALYDCINKHPVKKDDISPSFSFIYDNFLCELKIALMSENGSMDLIDNVDNAIAILRGDIVEDDSSEADKKIDHTSEIEEQEVSPVYNKGYNDNSLDVEHVYLDLSHNIEKAVTTSSLNDSQEKLEITENRKGKAWTQEEEERIAHYFERGISTPDIAKRIGRTEVAIKSRLAKLGLIEYTYGQDESDDTNSNVVPINPDNFHIENKSRNCYIFDKYGKKVFTDDGKLKFIRGKFYRLNMKKECFTIKDMRFDGEVWMKGDKKIVAYPMSRLYRAVNGAFDYYESIDDILDSSEFKECKLKFNGVWYDNLGNITEDSLLRNTATEELPKQHHDYLTIIKHPLYAVRKQALLCALGYFKLPAKIKDIARTISRTAWRAPIKEDDVKEIISTLKDVESSDGKFILRKKQ